MIFERDKYTCQETGKTSKEEKLHAAHWSHDKSKKNYDDPENGRVLSISMHYLDHFYRSLEDLGLSLEANIWALNALWGALDPWQKKKLPKPDEYGKPVQMDFLDMASTAAD